MFIRRFFNAGKSLFNNAPTYPTYNMMLRHFSRPISFSLEKPVKFKVGGNESIFFYTANEEKEYKEINNVSSFSSTLPHNLSLLIEQVDSEKHTFIINKLNKLAEKQLEKFKTLVTYLCDAPSYNHKSAQRLANCFFCLLKKDEETFNVYYRITTELTDVIKAKSGLKEGIANLVFDKVFQLRESCGDFNHFREKIDKMSEYNLGARDYIFTNISKEQLDEKLHKYFGEWLDSRMLNFDIHTYRDNGSGPAYRHRSMK